MYIYIYICVNNYNINIYMCVLVHMLSLLLLLFTFVDTTFSAPPSIMFIWRVFALCVLVLGAVYVVCAFAFAVLSLCVIAFSDSL